MMRSAAMVAVFFLMFTPELPASELDDVRKAFYRASLEQAVCENIYNKIKDNDYVEKPLMLGYQGVYQAIMAKYLWNPFSKWWYFKSGVDRLENAINMDGQNIELIFLRFSVQTNCPEFLGYHSNIREDKAFIMSKIFDEEIRYEYRFFMYDIINYMKESAYLTFSERDALRKIDVSANRHTP